MVSDKHPLLLLGGRFKHDINPSLATVQGWPPLPDLQPATFKADDAGLAEVMHMCLSLCPICRRWVDQHGDQARQLQAVDGARQQAEDRVAVLTTQLEQEQQQLAQQRSR